MLGGFFSFFFFLDFLFGVLGVLGLEGKGEKGECGGEGVKEGRCKNRIQYNRIPRSHPSFHFKNPNSNSEYGDTFFIRAAGREGGYHDL